MSMSGGEVALRLLAGALLTLANAFFVGTEFALTRLRQLPEDEFRDDPRLERAWKMTERLEIHLTGCQLGITTTSILLGVVAEPAVTAVIAPLLGPLGIRGRVLQVTAVVVAVVLINLVHKIWGEQTPTYLGVERPKAVARHAAAALDRWTRVMYPIIIAGDGLAKLTLRLFGIEIRRSWTREEPEEPEEAEGPADHAELRRAVVEVLGRGELSSERRQEVVRALDIDRIPVRQIMVPAEDVVFLSTERSTEDNLEVIRQHRFSRLPLVRGSLDDRVGTIYVPALFAELDAVRAGDRSLADIATPTPSVPADMPVSELIDRFQELNQELALVVEENGEQGAVIGLVTSTDTFEAIAGELYDPFD